MVVDRHHRFGGRLIDDRNKPSMLDIPEYWISLCTKVSRQNLDPSAWLIGSRSGFIRRFVD